MGPVGLPEMVAIFVIALILFGPKKLPELGRIIGKGLSEFRRAKSELKSTFESHLNELEKETRVVIPPTASVPSVTEHPPSTYSYPYDEYGAYSSENSQETVASAPAIPPQQPAELAAEVRDEATVYVAPVAGTVARGSSAFKEEHHS